MASVVRRHLVNSLNKQVCGGHRSWESGIAANVLEGRAPLMGTLCMPTLGRWRPTVPAIRSPTCTFAALISRQLLHCCFCQ